MKDSWRFERHEDWENLRWRQKLWIKSLFKWQSMVFYGKLPHFGPSLSRIMFDSYLKVIRSQFLTIPLIRFHHHWVDCDTLLWLEWCNFGLGKYMAHFITFKFTLMTPIQRKNTFFLYLNFSLILADPAIL